MKIVKILTKNRDTFLAKMQCEHCSKTCESYGSIVGYTPVALLKKCVFCRKTSDDLTILGIKTAIHDLLEVYGKRGVNTIFKQYGIDIKKPEKIYLDYFKVEKLARIHSEMRAILPK